MRTRLISAALLAGAVLLTGCGKKDGVQGKTGDEITAKSSNSDIGEAYVNELTRIAGALETVDDEASAEAAAKKIKVAVDGLNAMQDKLEGKIQGPQALQIFGGRYQELIQVQQRIAMSMMDIQQNNPDLMETISEEMDKLE